MSDTNADTNTDADAKKTAPLITKIDVTAHDDTAVDKVDKGDTAKTENSGAVVITKRAILKAPATPAGSDDSALTGGDAADPATDTTKKPTASNNAPAIKPLTPAATDPKPAATANPNSDPAPDPKPAAPDKTEAVSVPEAAAPDESKAEMISDEEKEAQKTEAELTAAAEAKVKHDETIQKLVDSKQYYLPVNAVEKRKSKQFAILGVFLSVLLLLAWVDIALDAGLIQINGVKPVTHFFSN